LTTRRRERGSIVLTSNRGFGDWNGVFPDRVVVSAIVERLMHKRPVLNIGRQQLDARLLSPFRRQERVVLSAELSSLRPRLSRWCKRDRRHPRVVRLVHAAAVIAGSPSVSMLA